MERREVRSLIGCFLISLLIAVLVLLGLGWDRRADAKPSPSGEAAAAEIVVAVELPPAPEESPLQPAEEPPSGLPPSLASQQEGAGEKPLSEMPEPQLSSAEAPEVPEETASAEPAVPRDPVPDPSPETAEEERPEQADMEGRLPPFVHRGETELLARMYPRIEMAWVLESDDAGDRSPRIVLEIVLDTHGEVHWRNLWTGRASPFFADATMRHVLDERVQPPAGARLRLASEPALFQRALAEAGMPPVVPSRVRWGYYRHRSEVYELGRAAQAFTAAAQQERVAFHPDRSDYLEITWSVDSRGEPAVGELHFRPETGDAVDLTDLLP